MRKRYIQDPVTLKLVPAELYRRQHSAHYVQEEIKPFWSPVDGSMITSRKELREHNARNGVVNAEGIGEVHRRRQEINKSIQEGTYDRKRRVDAVKFATEVHQRGRSKADISQMVENYRKEN